MWVWSAAYPAFWILVPPRRQPERDRSWGSYGIMVEVSSPSPFSMEEAARFELARLDRRPLAKGLGSTTSLHRPTRKGQRQNVLRHGLRTGLCSSWNQSTPLPDWGQDKNDKYPVAYLHVL